MNRPLYRAYGLVKIKHEASWELIIKQMKTGDVISKSDLIQKGFYLSCWFAGYVVFKKFNQEEEDYTYVFLDYWTNEINNILTSKQ